MSALTRAGQMLRHLDELPVSPRNLARAALRRFHDRQEAAAMHDPVYADIEARRHAGRDGSIAFLNDELSWADWEEQLRIEATLTPEPRWVPLARRVADWRLDGPLRTARRALARTRQGWAPDDTWNLGHHLARVTAGMLEHLAAHNHGWPQSEEFPTAEDWDATLRAVAADLRRMDDDPHYEAMLDAWYALATDRDADPDAERAARERLNEAETARDAAVTAAMHWVAEHLYALWD